VDASEIDARYIILSENLMAVSRRFVFNVNETGRSEHIDSDEVTVVLPIDYPHPSDPVSVNRLTMRSTLSSCIAAEGYRMKPFVIVDRATVGARAGLHGYDRSNVFLAPQENGFMTTRLFELWAKEVFCPAVAQRRAQFGSRGMALLLLNGLGSHHIGEFLKTCANRGIDVLFIVPSLSDQPQPVHFLTFAVIKRHFSSSRFVDRRPQS
jgi:hypothetical protein